MSTEIESLELKIVSDSKNATKGIDALTQSLKRLSGATSGLTGVSKKIGQIATATDKASRSGKNASTSFTDLYYKLKTAARGFQMVGKTIYSAIQKSSDYVENVNLFTVAMGDYAGEAKEYAETVGEAMGIDPGEWMRNQGVFMTLATGFGVAGDRAAVMSKNLTQLGYDLSSFFNISYEDAMQKLQSGLSGELEPLRRIGYDLSQAKLEATALELGIDKTVSSMTQAEKAQLRYYAIMTQVTTAQGDMARTLDAPANQLKVFKAQVNMAGREIGNVFIPALNAVLPYAIAVAKVIRALASTIASIVGFEMPEVDYSGVNAMGNTATDTSEALEDATKSAKKLKSYMLGFDELNVVNPTDNSALGGIDDVVNDFNFELPEYDFLERLAETKIASIVEKMKEWLGITDDIDSWSDLFHSKLGLILGVVGLIGSALLIWKIADDVIDGVNAISNLGKAGTMTLGLTLAVVGITIGALAIENALTEGLNGVNIGALLIASASIIAGGALIGKVFGGTIIGAAIGAIIAGVAGLGIGIYDAIKNELNIANGLTIALGATLIGIGVASLLPTIQIAGLTFGGTFGKAFLGAAMGLVVGGAIAGAIWLYQNTDTWLEKIGGLVSGALLAVGAVLAFMGISLPLGLGLMAAGAVSMGASIALNTDALSDEVKDVIAVITTVVSLALLAVGAILAFTGVNIPLGIALMAGGALTLGTAIVPNWNELSDSVQDIISIIMASVGAALLVLGAIFAFSGANIPLGIGLMLVGAASLGTALALNWDAVSEALQGPVGAITALISGALLVLGAILAFTGVGIPIGIALMLAGAAGLATVITLNWNSIKTTIKNVLNSLLKIVSGAMLVLGVLMCLSGAGIGLGLALIFGALKLSNTAWGTDDNPITNFVKKMVNGIVKIINKAIDGINEMFHIKFDGLVIGGVEIIPSFNIRMLNIPNIPLMAEGGFPEQGQMFIAREAGAEMVGNIGRRTAVVNNEQIVASISGGVAEANEEQNALLREQNSLLKEILEKDSGVYLDGKSLTNSVEKHQRERGRVLITGGVI